MHGCERGLVNKGPPAVAKPGAGPMRKAGLAVGAACRPGPWLPITLPPQIARAVSTPEI